MEKFRKILAVLFWITAVPFALLPALAWGNCAGLIAAGSLLSGFDYFPPKLLAILFIPTLLLGLVSKKIKETSALFLLVAAFVFTYEDHSLFRNLESGKGHEGSRKICIMTYNVSQFIGHKSMAYRIEDFSPDIACIQEHGEYENLDVKEIEAALPSYQVALGRIDENGILSKFPIKDFKEIELPTLKPFYENNTPEKLESFQKRRKAFVHAVISIEGKDVNIISLRLFAGRGKDIRKFPGEVLRWGKYEIESQARETKVISEYISGLKGPIVFAGDMNAPPCAHVLEGFKKLGKDAFRATNRLGGNTFSVSFPFERMDMIFYNEGLIPVESDVLGWQNSDHFPVFANFILNRV